jgi:hypothetical protein
MPFVSGLDLAQTTDFSALATLEQSLRDRADQPKVRGQNPEQESVYTIRGLRRFERGMRYLDQAAETKKVFDRPPLQDTQLILDETGVGKAAIEIFRAAGIRAWIRPVVITAGHATTPTEDGGWHVPKKELAHTLVSLLEGGRLLIPRAAAEAEMLRKELQNFRVKITKAANETFAAWREGDHDDLVLAVALAAWVGEHSPIAWDGSIGVAERGQGGRSVIADAPDGVFCQQEVARDPDRPDADAHAPDAIDWNTPW